MMSYVNNFLNRLQKVKQVGDDKYSALCPVHDDNNPSMTIKIVDDKILAYCFACGAKAPAIAEVVGLKTSDLFSGDTPFAPDRDYKLMQKKELDDTFLLIHEKSVQKKEKMRHSDYKFMRQAKARRQVREEKGLE
tara:strand:+ start:340 stop:744 length:405 start_codon:yes stop_codon:yes gene_type:complete